MFRQHGVQQPLENVTFNGEDMVVGLGMLLSYADIMGVAEIGCVQGCTCNCSTFSTRIQYSGYSMTYWQFLTVKVCTHVCETNASQGPRPCRLDPRRCCQFRKSFSALLSVPEEFQCFVN